MRLSVVVFINVLLGWIGSVYAAPNDYPVYLSDQELSVRLDETSQLLDTQQTNAQYWEYGWGTFDGGTMIWSATEAGHEKDLSLRNTEIVQAVESLFGLADVSLRRLPAFDADSVCKDTLTTEQDRLECLVARETLLQESAERASDPQKFFPHAANAGFNLIAGLVVWKAGGGGNALKTAIPGEIIGELQLLSTPSGPIADWAHYQMHFYPVVLQTGNQEKPSLGFGFSMDF